MCAQTSQPAQRLCWSGGDPFLHSPLD
jgi:hypothetical protein